MLATNPIDNVAFLFSLTLRHNRQKLRACATYPASSPILQRLESARWLTSPRRAGPAAGPAPQTAPASMFREPAHHRAAQAVRHRRGAAPAPCPADTRRECPRLPGGNAAIPAPPQTARAGSPAGPARPHRRCAHRLADPRQIRAATASDPGSVTA